MACSRMHDMDIIMSNLEIGYVDLDVGGSLCRFAIGHFRGESAFAIVDHET